MGRQELRAGRLFVWAVRCWAVGFLVACTTHALDTWRVQWHYEPLYWLGLLLVFAGGLALCFGESEDAAAMRAGLEAARWESPTPPLLPAVSSLARSAGAGSNTNPLQSSVFPPHLSGALDFWNGRGKVTGDLEQVTGSETFVNYRCRYIMDCLLHDPGAAVPTACPGPTPWMGDRR